MKNLLCILLLASGVSFSASHKEARLRVVYTANRQGEIEPCGCQVHQVGGLNRAQALLDQANKEAGAPPRFFGDAGDSFFARGQLSGPRRDQEILRAKVLAQGCHQLGLDAFTPGERDFAGGLETLRELQRLSGSVFISTNLTDKAGKLLFEPWHVFEKGGLRVCALGLADPTAFAAVSEVVVRPPKEALADGLKYCKKEDADVVILLSHLGLKGDLEVAEAGGVAVVLGSHSLDAFSKPLLRGPQPTIIVQPLDQGQQLGILDLLVANPAGSGHRLVDLDTAYDLPNESRQLMEKYRVDVRALASVGDKPPLPPSAKDPYVANPFYCKTCHPKQYEWWENTKHASAYLVLYAKNQHFDPECIACHSLGFEAPGGFQKIAAPLVLDHPQKNARGTPPLIDLLMKKVFAQDPGKGPLDSRTDPARFQKLRQAYWHEVSDLAKSGQIKNWYVGVQCENCHGNRHGHPSPDVPTLKKVAEASCRACHQPPNAPGFDPAWIKKIGCPLAEK